MSLWYPTPGRRRSRRLILCLPKRAAQLELALARGKKLYDKREVEKKRSWERERGRLLQQKG
jgi:tmRNA-binding protein